jgi:hypothetical protein
MRHISFLNPRIRTLNTPSRDEGSPISEELTEFFDRRRNVTATCFPRPRHHHRSTHPSNVRGK